LDGCAISIWFSLGFRVLLFAAVSASARKSASISPIGAFQSCEFIAKRLAPAEPSNDGRQTPMRGHPVFVAQHATATCCRSCLHKWHAIAAGRSLTPAEQEHVVAAIARWLDAEQR
jgi:hypothetical protein